MSTRLGLAVAHGCVRAVLVRAGTAIWTCEVAVDDPGLLADAIAKLLCSAPVPRWRRAAVAVAMGPSLTQVRQIRGLPSLTDERALASIVREGVSRFFLRGESRLLTTAIRYVEPGCVLAAAIDEAGVRAVITGCASARFRLRALTPAVVVIGAGLYGDELFWRDGPVEVRVLLEHGKLRSVHRIGKRSQADGQDPRPKPSLAKLEDRGWRFADAYGAALLPHHEPLLLRPAKEMAGPRRVPVWRIAAAALVAPCCIASALAARGLAAVRARDDAEIVLTRLSGDYRSALADRSDLQTIAKVLDQVAEFEATRQSVTLLLGVLARVLPERTALTALRVDSAGGTIVVLGPSAANMMSTLENAPGLDSPEMVGPITQEVVAGERLERVTVRFRFAPPKPNTRPADAADQRTS
jgi:Tfp pilus assembly protein PilN